MKVLLAIDQSVCSEAAIATILNHVFHNHMEVLIFHVIDSCQLTPVSLSFAEGTDSASQYASVRHGWHTRANALVTSTAERLQAAGISASTLVREGDPRTLIVEQARQWQADMIVVGGHGWKGLDRFLMGSVSGSVVRHAPCSTLVVRPTSRQKPVRDIQGLSTELYEARN